MRRLFRLAILAILFAGCSSAAQKPDEKVVVFAAASTRHALEDLAATFQREAAITVQVVPGPSSSLAKQIELGGHADLFLSADQASAERVSAQGLVEKRRNLLTNRLVLIVPADSPLKIADLPGLLTEKVHRIAIAEPKVPAGEYARESLRKLDLLTKLEGKFVGGVDVTATLQLVALGEADAGFVYRTDTLGNSKVRIEFEVDPQLHRPIEYPLLLLKSAAAKPAAGRFYDYLGSSTAWDVFRRLGFGIAP
jgi:molybdate transport system substrate-binding protein